MTYSEAKGLKPGDILSTFAVPKKFAVTCHIVKVIEVKENCVIADVTSKGIDYKNQLFAFNYWYVKK